jgi:cytochrome o ubiquinol oxidase operon protein cyoD
MAYNVTRDEISHGTPVTYIVGFVLSILLTMGAYFLVSYHLLTAWPLILTITGLGLIQVIVQLIFFLHLGGEVHPHRNLLSFIFMSVVIVVVIGGSLWIMYNLNERTMEPMMQEMHHNMNHHDLHNESM